jgi:hypothetical protein
MLWRSEAAPRELLAQAAAVAELTRSAARYFREPSEPAAIAVKARVTDALERGRAAKAALRRGEDWLAISRALADLAEHSGRSVAQAKLYGVERQASLGKAAMELREAAAALDLALRREKGRAERLVEAKRWVSNADRTLARLRAGALEDPRVVAGLRDREVYKRLGAAAEAAHAALERLAEVAAGT